MCKDATIVLSPSSYANHVISFFKCRFLRIRFYNELSSTPVRHARWHARALGPARGEGLKRSLQRRLCTHGTLTRASLKFESVGNVSRADRWPFPKVSVSAHLPSKYSIGTTFENMCLGQQRAVREHRDLLRRERGRAPHAFSSLLNFLILLRPPKK